MYLVAYYNTERNVRSRYVKRRKRVHKVARYKTSTSTNHGYHIRDRERKNENNAKHAAALESLHNAPFQQIAFEGKKIERS